MESNSTPSPEADPATPVGPGVDNVPPPEPTEDPAARSEAEEADAPEPTQTSQDVPAEEIEQNPLTPPEGGDPANAVHRQAPAPPEWQGGRPNPGDERVDRAPTQTAGGSTDGLSAGTQADDNVEVDHNPDDSDR